ncbi:MAG: hypothetical protein L3J32_09145 [Rhizobiaceae bacterium]|nr:hypothetical protein [Rhizobiaceae bacterium]
MKILGFFGNSILGILNFVFGLVNAVILFGAVFPLLGMMTNANGLDFGFNDPEVQPFWVLLGLVIGFGIIGFVVLKRETKVLAVFSAGLPSFYAGYLYFSGFFS